MALEMKAECETCSGALPMSAEAWICSHECTFCTPCAEDAHNHKCPNCGGELVRRPRRES